MTVKNTFFAGKLVFIVVAGIACSAPAAGEIQFDEGRWRLELSHGRGVHSGSTDRTSDFYHTVSLEYETPATSHITLGLRALPVFLYHDDESDAIYGAGVGLTGRLYQHADSHTGLFGEVGAAALWHSRHFENNSSSINFLTEAGVGYRFPEHWHVSVKFQHISNAGLGGCNSGANGVTLALGYTF